MNKLTIPALLLGVVMVAGAFAFMPVQEASTVHTSTSSTENSIRYFTVTATCNVTDGDTDDCNNLDIDIPTNAVYSIVSAQMSTTDDDAVSATDIAFTDCSAGGVDAKLLGLVLDTVGPIPASSTQVDNVHNPTADFVFIGSALTTDIRCDGANATTDGDSVVIKMVILINADAADPTATFE